MDEFDRLERRLDVRLWYFLMGLVCGMMLVGVVLAQDPERDTTNYILYIDNYSVLRTENYQDVMYRYDHELPSPFRGKVFVVQEDCNRRIISEKHMTR